MNKEYKQFLENKIVVAESFGFQPYENLGLLFPHQNDIVNWCIEGGRRAIFASFGLGKTFMQLSIARQCILKENKPFLIALPLGVVGEFKRDNNTLNTGYDIQYIKDTDSIDNYEPKIYVTNYERIRKGDIDSSKFCGVSFDEASILRNLKTETTNYVLEYFTKIPYRYVATATPTPNDFIEILNYAVFLNVIDRGHALTRFFQRDSTKAGHLTLYPNKKDEFWKWVSTWAIFINKPSDLGYDDTGYDLPQLDFKEVVVFNEKDMNQVEESGQITLIKKTPKGLSEQSKEKACSIELRCKEAVRIALENHPNENIIFWHHREAERECLENLLKEHDYKSVFGGQTNDLKEKLLIDFSNGDFKYLLTKPQIAGSGCNFQKHCHINIFVGIDDKFNDFIQAMHRTHRFGQKEKVICYAILTQNEQNTLKNIKRKWKQHIELQTEMINIVRDYGLNTEKIKSDMKRQLFNGGKELKVGKATLVNGDTVLETSKMESNSQGLIVSSIPFGDHYEYSDNYNCFGHNESNKGFWNQMDYLIPELHRVLKPGRVACIHVKDRIRYSYQNGAGFTTIDDFASETSRAFQKHGFWLIGKITVTTDVVRENNQTYRLGWSEQCKDASKMGVGLPEYIYLFRKAPTSSDNAYADEPVMKYKTNKSKMYDCFECKTSFEPLEAIKIQGKDKTKYVCPTCQSHHDEAEINAHSYDVTDEEKLTYEIDRWQLDAHAYWRSSGDRFMSFEELQKYDMKRVYNNWKEHQKQNIYDYRDHLQSCRDLDDLDKLSRLFMTLPTISNNDLVWTDINRMNTLNANQANKKKEKHICPLQLDIIERLINRFSMKTDSVFDPFGGIMSTPYIATKLGRESRAHELKKEYFEDGVFHLKALEYKLSVPTLFDVL